MARRKRTRELFGEPVKPLTFAEYEAQAQDCDLLLWEPTTLYGRVIAYGTGGPISHISTVLRCNGILWSAGLEEKSGRGVKVPLKAEIHRWPGKISVFRVNGLADESRSRIVAALLENLEASYCWGAIRISALWQLGLFRMSMIFPHWRDWYERKVAKYDEQNQAVCSQYIHRSFSKGAGHRMFVKKTSSLVSPNDIGQSADTEYLGTLVK